MIGLPAFVKDPDRLPDLTLEQALLLVEDEKDSGVCHPDQAGSEWEFFTKRQIEVFREDQQQADPPVRLISFSEIQPREKDFLAYPRVPAGGITLLGGDGGTGKTSIACCLAAAVSRGEDCFIGEMRRYPCKIRNPGKVLLLMTEDDSASVIVKRLADYSAKTSNIITVATDQLSKIQFNPTNSYLSNIIEQIKPELCIFDPLQAFIPSGVNMGSRNDMRHALNYVKSICEKTETSALILMHTNKRSDAWGRNRFADSSDIWDLARSALITGKTQEKGVNYLSLEKSNYASTISTETILYSMERGKVEIRGTTDHDDEYFVKASNKRRRGDNSDIEDLLKETLSAAGGSMSASDLENALKAQSATDRGIRSAKKNLKEQHVIDCKRKDFGGEYFFTLL